MPCQIAPVFFFSIQRPSNVLLALQVFISKMLNHFYMINCKTVLWYNGHRTFCYVARWKERRLWSSFLFCLFIFPFKHFWPKPPHGVTLFREIQLLKDVDTLKTVYDRNRTPQVGRFEGGIDLLKRKLDKITTLKMQKKQKARFLDLWVLVYFASW